MVARCIVWEELIAEWRTVEVERSQCVGNSVRKEKGNICREMTLTCYRKKSEKQVRAQRAV